MGIIDHEGKGGQQEMNGTDKARAYLETFFKPEYSRYIQTELAGDFAWQLAELLRKTDSHNKDAVSLPKALTAENGAKALLMGEFFESNTIDCPVHNML